MTLDEALEQSATIKIQPPAFLGSSAVVDLTEDLQEESQRRCIGTELAIHSMSQQSVSVTPNRPNASVQSMSRQEDPLTTHSAIQPMHSLREEWQLHRGRRARIQPTMPHLLVPNRPAPIIVQPPPLPGYYYRTHPGYAYGIDSHFSES